MDFEYRDDTIPEDTASWTDIPRGLDSLISDPTEEFSEDVHFFSDLGSLSSSDADSTPRSYNSDSSGFRDAQQFDLATIQETPTASLTNISCQAEASAERVNTELLPVESHHIRNDYPDLSSSFPFSVLHHGQFLEIPHDETAHHRTTDSNEMTLNCESSDFNGFDELTKTITENCSIADLMNLPLDDNILQPGNNIEGEPNTIPRDLNASPRNGGKLRRYNNHKMLPSPCVLNPSEVYEPDVLPDHIGSNFIYSQPCVSNQKFPMTQAVGPIYENSYNGCEVQGYSLNVGKVSTDNELISEDSCAFQNSFPFEFHGSNTTNMLPLPNEQKQLKSDEHLSIPLFEPNTSSSSTAADLGSIELIKKPKIIDQKYIFNGKGNKNLKSNHAVLTPQNSESVETESNKTSKKNSPVKKSPVLKFKRVAGLKDFYVCSKSPTQANYVSEKQDDEVHYANDISNQPQEKASLSISTTVEEKLNDDSSTSPTSSGPASKICGVCGDVAKSMHFGGMACDSCKAFFRRSVQGKYWKKFRCSVNKSCKIRKSSRRSCQFCRFAKCRKNGMKISWVMTEEERLVLWKKRLTKHQNEESDEHVSSLLGTMNHYSYMNRKHFGCDNGQTNYCDVEDSYMECIGLKENLRRQQKSSTAKCDGISSKREDMWSPPSGLIAVLAGGSKQVPDKFIYGTSVSTYSEDHPLSDRDRVAINKLIQAQNDVFSRISYPKECEGNTVESMLNIHINICEKLSSYYRENEDLRLLSRADRVVLCRNGFISSLVIHSLYNFDKNSKSWPRKSCLNSIKTPYVSFDMVAKFINSSNSAEKYLNFCLYYSQDFQDEGVLALMFILCVVYEVESPHELDNEILVTECREKYLHLLIRYLRFRQGERGYIVTLPRLFTVISEAKKFATFSHLAQIDMSHTVQHARNMIRTVELVQDMTAQPLSLYSSVMARTSNEAEKTKSKEGLHHPVTKAIFGPTQVDILLVDPFEQMLRYDDDKFLTPEHNSHVTDAHEELKGSSHNSVEEMTWKASDEQKKTDSGIEFDFDVNEKGTQSTKEDNGIWSEEKKVGIQVLCEMLQNIARNGDPRMIELLSESLPSELVQHVTSKFSK